MAAKAIESSAGYKNIFTQLETHESFFEYLCQESLKYFIASFLLIPTGDPNFRNTTVLHTDFQHTFCSICRILSDTASHIDLLYLIVLSEATNMPATISIMVSNSRETVIQPKRHCSVEENGHSVQM